MLHNEDRATLTTLQNLSLVLSKSGSHHDAIVIADHVLQVGMRKFGKGNPETIIAKGGLGLAYLGNSDNEKALELFTEATATSINLKSLGPKHPITLINLFNLALTHFERGETNLAEDGCASIVDDLER